MRSEPTILAEHEFKDPDTRDRYVFSFYAEYPGYVDIAWYRSVRPSGRCWLHPIRNGQVVWRGDDFIVLTDKAKQYLHEVVTKWCRLKAFW